MLIKARQKDLNTVLNIYGEVLSLAANTEYSNWKKGDYPRDEIASDAIACGSLFLYYEDDLLKGSVILNSEQPTDYDKINWRYAVSADKTLVLHTLCIRPAYTGKGAGKRLLKDIEDYGREHVYEALRFDTYYANAPARHMYISSGYSEAGTAEIFVYGKPRLLVCFEKKL